MLDVYLIRPVRKLAEISAMLAAAVLMICVSITVFDIIMRNYFQGGITGVVEITQLAVIWAAFLTIPLGFAYENHIYVDLVTGGLRPRVRQFLRGIAVIAGAVVMAFYAWYGGHQALQQIFSAERTLTLGIPLSLFWTPILYGTSFSVVCAVTAYLALLTGSAAHTPSEFGHES